MSSISFLSDRYEDLRKDISAIRNNEILKEENIALKADLQDAHKELSIQENLLDDAEQYSRRDCLEVRGIPVQESEENTIHPDSITHTRKKFRDNTCALR